MIRDLLGRSRFVAAAPLLGVLTLTPGCQDNVPSVFPPGYEPFEEHTAPLPEPVGDDPCPETLVFVENERGARDPWNVHGTACIHQPITTVWASARNPTTSRDPTSTTTFMPIDPPIDPECMPGDYQTEVFVDDIVDVTFRTCWRHTVVLGTEEAPELTGTRWQKVFGSTFIPVMEGSLVLEPFEDDPSITVVRYQYHLEAVSSSADTVRNFLTVIYGRLRDHANGVPLDPP